MNYAWRNATYYDPTYEYATLVEILTDRHMLRVDRGNTLPANIDYYDTDEATELELPFTWGDYVGSTYERSNAEAMAEDFEDVFATVGVRFDMFGTSIYYLDLDYWYTDATDEEWEQLAQFCEELYRIKHDYPVYDDDHHSELERVIFEEEWEEWLRADFARDSGLTEAEVDEAAAWVHYQGFLDYPYAETATGSVVWPGFERWITTEWVPARHRHID